MGEERLRDIYPHATKWQVMKWKFRKFVRFILKTTAIGGVTGGALYLAFFLGQYTVPATIYAERIDNMPWKVEQLKNDVVNQIKSCESGGHKEEDGLIILDTNNKMSIGQLQFQTNTVKHYYKTLYDKVITTKEAIEIAIDTDKATALAKDIIFQTDKGLTNWITCANKFDSKAQVKIIKKLEK